MAKKADYTFTLAGIELTAAQARKIEKAVEKIAEKFDLGWDSMRDDEIEW